MLTALPCTPDIQLLKHGKWKCFHLYDQICGQQIAPTSVYLLGDQPVEDSSVMVRLHNINELKPHAHTAAQH